MLMKFSQNRNTATPRTHRLKGRHGHRLARLNDILFVLGGAEETGTWATEVQRINCRNGRVDSLILESALALEGFSLFAYQQNLFLWGGNAYSQCTDQLLRFEGSHFSTLPQHGQIPAPRTAHFSTTFSTKFLVLFGGHDQKRFYNDWHLLNLQTLTWTTLKPSIDVGFASAGQMAWLGGRGILFLTENYYPDRQLYATNQLFQFYVSDFKRGTLAVKRLPLPLPSHLSPYLFTHLSPYNGSCFLLYAGHHKDNISATHSFSYLVDLEEETSRAVSLDVGSLLSFQSCFYKDTLCVVGGDHVSCDPDYSGLMLFTLSPQPLSFKRHVCQLCHLYFDQEYSHSTREIYSVASLKEDYDYVYHMRLDNRVLQRFSCYIASQFYAVVQLLDSLGRLNCKAVDLHFEKDLKTQSNGNSQLPRSYLRIFCRFSSRNLKQLYNSLLLQRYYDEYHLDKHHNNSQHTLQIRLATLRLSKATLFVFAINENDIAVVYYSSQIIETVFSHFLPLTSYSYHINPRTKEVNEPNNRIIIFQNMKPLFKSPQQYQYITGGHLQIFTFPPSSLQHQLTLLDSNPEPQTIETNPIPTDEQYKRHLQLIQLCFLPSCPLPVLTINSQHFGMINLYEIIENDKRSNILQNLKLPATPSIVHKVSLALHPEQYCLKRILVYHKSRLINHLKYQDVCGIIELKEETQVDLAGNLALQSQKMVLQDFIIGINRKRRIN